MKRPALLQAPAGPRKPNPFEAEIDRLLDLRANGYITQAEYLADKAEVERAQRQAERA